MSDKKKTKSVRVMTPPFRVSFPHVFKPHSGFANQEPKYSIQMLFDSNADLKEMKAAVAQVVKETWGEKKDWPENLRLTLFKDGNKKKLDNYKNKILVEARSKNKPGLVDRECNDIINQDEFYPGCWARATLSCYPYFKPSPGVSFGLENIQKVKDDAAFSGKKNAKDDFEALPELDGDDSGGGDDFSETSEEDDF